MSEANAPNFLDSLKSIFYSEKAKPKRGFRYKIYRAEGKWHWWIEVPDLGIKISSNLIGYATEELAKNDMNYVLSELGWSVTPKN